MLNGKDGFQFDVYPNPAKGQATILATQFKGITFRLMDMTGKVVLQKELEESATSISLNTLPAGIYQMAYSNSIEVLFQDKLVIE
ncbi:MAG: T9SS type A sorting domain-containing protein [Bacteroidota bacterium]|nr:MAG: T9SS type A sorting domain-containing protein [Bacteroidota bacterium]